MGEIDIRPEIVRVGLDATRNLKTTQQRVFKQIAQRLYWAERGLIAFVDWGYFDESGEHDKSGRLTRISIGGCIATLEGWNRFDQEWGNALASEGVAHFHGSEFFSKKAGFGSQYYGWSGERRAAFLDCLLAAMEGCVRVYVGVKQIPWRDPAKVRDMYTRGVAGAIVRSQNVSHAGVWLVFAAHPELPSSALSDYHGKIKIALPDFKGVSVLDPKTVNPLQAADLFCYQLSHCKNWQDIDNLSYSLRRLRSGEASFSVWPHD
jgi:hypothetical protein